MLKAWSLRVFKAWEFLGSHNSDTGYDKVFRLQGFKTLGTLVPKCGISGCARFEG